MTLNLSFPALPLEPAPADFTQRALHAELVLSLLREYLTKMVQDAAENDPTAIIRDTDLVRSIDAHLSDLAGDIAGTLNQVAEQLADDRYAGVSTRGPFYRRRSV